MKSRRPTRKKAAPSEGKKKASGKATKAAYKFGSYKKITLKEFSVYAPIPP